VAGGETSEGLITSGPLEPRRPRGRRRSADHRIHHVCGNRKTADVIGTAKAIATIEKWREIADEIHANGTKAAYVFICVPSPIKLSTTSNMRSRNKHALEEAGMAPKQIEQLESLLPVDDVIDV